MESEGQGHKQKSDVGRQAGINAHACTHTHPPPPFPLFTRIHSLACCCMHACTSQVPETTTIERIAEAIDNHWLACSSGREARSWDRMSLLVRDLKGLNNCAGVLSVPVVEDGQLLFLRPELYTTIRWAGKDDGVGPGLGFRGFIGFIGFRLYATIRWAGKDDGEGPDCLLRVRDKSLGLQRVSCCDCVSCECTCVCVCVSVCTCVCVYVCMCVCKP